MPGGPLRDPRAPETTHHDPPGRCQGRSGLGGARLQPDRGEPHVVGGHHLYPHVGGLADLAHVQDPPSRRIVGWAMADHLRAELVVDALQMALAQRKPDTAADRLIHHSDQGSQYTAVLFTGRCEQAGITPSTGSRGDCFDNAVCESFHASLKKELIYRHGWPTRAEALVPPSSSTSRAGSTPAGGTPPSATSHPPNMSTSTKTSLDADARHPVAQHPSHRMSSPHRQPSPSGTPGARRAWISLAPPTAPRGISGTSHTLHQVNPCPRERGGPYRRSISSSAQTTAS